MGVIKYEILKRAGNVVMRWGGILRYLKDKEL